MLPSQTENGRSIEQARTKPPINKDPRRIQRISLPLPARVEVRVDSNVTWNEITRLTDVSAFGAGFQLKRPVKRGRMVALTLPMPRQLRSFDYSEPQYRVWALVRRCIATNKPGDPSEFAVGVAFTGKHPPAGYVDHPSMLYDIAYRDSGDAFWHLRPADLMADESELPKEIRKQTRLFIPESLTLQKVDAAGNVMQEEVTVTENISLGGAALFTTMDADEGSFLRVRSDRLDITMLAIVRTKRLGADGISRVHVEFIDRFFPLEGIE